MNREEPLVPPEVDPASLVDDAWRLIEQALHTGTMTLSNKTQMSLEPKNVLDVAYKLAATRKPKRKLVSTQEDFIQPTKR